MDLYIKLKPDKTLRDVALEIQQLNEFWKELLINGPIKCNPDSYREETVYSTEATPVLDSDGNQTYDIDGNPITEYLPLKDDDGNIITKQVEVPEGFLGDVNTPPNEAGYITVRICNYESLEWEVFPTSFTLVSGYPIRGDNNEILPSGFI